MSANTLNVPWMEQFREMTAGIAFCKPRAGQAGTIYFIEAEGADMLKIGFTAFSAQKRLKAIQTGSPHKLRIIAEIPGVFEDERELHKRFKALRMQGEWFRLDGAIKEFIREKGGVL